MSVKEREEARRLRLILDEIESYWLDRLGLPRSSPRKATVNNASSASKRMKRNLQSIYGAIQEYGGFDDPAWLG